MEIFKKLIERVVVFGKVEDKQRIFDYCKQNQLRIVGTGKRPLSKDNYSDTEIKVVAEKDVYPKAVAIGNMKVTDFKKQEQMINKKRKPENKKQNNTKKDKPVFNAPKISGNKTLLFINDETNNQNKKNQNKKFNSQKKR